MELKDKRIIEFLDKRIKEKGLDKEKFLNPKIDDLRDANLLFNMDKAVNRINDAISKHERILIYGDYDADGICSSTILYLFFKSRGADVNVFIPNRFENGYGISPDAIEEIIEVYSPELIVTVDLGITAIQEVELLKAEGIDVVITDHHIPLNEIPNTIVVDPKLDPDGKYGFDGLCGAGVALKLVEAMSDRREALKYIDICSIATVGDIVPLIDENRIIAKFGVSKINRGDTLPSIKFLLNKLEISQLCSSDISFKIVPRLNACGRMDNAIKVFHFLIEENPKQLELKYSEIESDNALRIGVIESGIKTIKKCLETYDRNEPSIVIQGDFHEGILGILASRICHEFNKPTLIFTTDESGLLKASGRSIGDIDIHKIISSLSNMLEHFGGHKVACGLSIEPENFDEFKREFNKKLLEEFELSEFIIDDSKYDIELTENDLNQGFLDQLEILAPFGCDNEKPVLAIRQNKIITEPINEKSFKHYRLTTSKNNSIISFNGYDIIEICKTESEKLVFIDLSYNFFRNRKNISIISKGIKLLSPRLSEDNSQDYLSALYNKYYSIFDYNKLENYHISDDLGTIIKEKFAESLYGTLVVASSQDDLNYLEKCGINVDKYISCVPMKNAQNTIVVSPRQVYKLESCDGYTNVIFLHKYFENEHIYFSQAYNVYESSKIEESKIEISKEREIFTRVYKNVISFSSLKSNDVLDFAEKLAIKDKTLSSCQILFCLIVFMELNFIEFDEKLNAMIVCSAKKTELSSSKFYNQVR